MVRAMLRRAWRASPAVIIALLWPVNAVLMALYRSRARPRSVLHVSSMVHVAYDTTRILRANGIAADYLARGRSSHWDRSDYVSPQHPIPAVQALLEFVFFWKVVARYEVLHLHFGLTMSRTGWELPWLRRLGRRIVVHYRGCEVRDYEVNVRLHPALNICQQCDYGRYCMSADNKARMALARRYGDAFLATTPDLRDFAPNAEHMPFFAPEMEAPERSSTEARFPHGPLRVLHWTNHPGIEGTDRIVAAVDALRARGESIELVVLKGVSQREVLEAIPQADVTIGKMKMGYYANAQIESMALGVPAITSVRAAFVTDALRESGLILAELDTLEQTLEWLRRHPDELDRKRRIARSSILRLHDNRTLAARYRDVYFPRSAHHHQTFGR